MDLGLRQRDVAELIGADTLTLWGWETNRTQPSICWMPTIIAFLGHAPYVPADSLEKWADNVRAALGMSRERLADLLGIDPGTFTRWLQGRGRPPSDFRDQLRVALLSGQ